MSKPLFVCSTPLSHNHLDYLRLKFFSGGEMSLYIESGNGTAECRLSRAQVEAIIVLMTNFYEPPEEDGDA